MSGSGHFECARNLGGQWGHIRPLAGVEGSRTCLLKWECSKRAGGALGRGGGNWGQSAPSPGPPGAAKGLSL